MAHKRLKGVRKARLSKIKVKTKHDKREDKSDRKKKKNAPVEAIVGEAPAPAEQEQGGGRKGPNQQGGRTMNKKEARAQASLEKMHRNLYSAGERILLVGEGNFSFTDALCKHLRSGAGVYATCLDSEAELRQKYPDAPACRKAFEALDGTCLTGVDATRLHKVKEFKGAFRKIVFNFPHMGGGEKDVDKSVAQHRQMLAAFFASAAKCLDPEHDAYVHVALKTGEPYKSWKVVQTAHAAAPELQLSTAVPFMASAWDGYAHRRTAGFSERHSLSGNEELAKGAKVFVFKKRKQSGDDESE